MGYISVIVISAIFFDFEKEAKAAFRVQGHATPERQSRETGPEKRLRYGYLTGYERSLGYGYVTGYERQESRLRYLTGYERSLGYGYVTGYERQKRPRYGYVAG